MKFQFSYIQLYAIYVDSGPFSFLIMCARSQHVKKMLL